MARGRERANLVTQKAPRKVVVATTTNLLWDATLGWRCGEVSRARAKASVGKGKVKATSAAMEVPGKQLLMTTSNPLGLALALAVASQRLGTQLIVAAHAPARACMAGVVNRGLM